MLSKNYSNMKIITTFTFIATTNNYFTKILGEINELDLKIFLVHNYRIKKRKAEKCLT
tara:strand:- start:8979 stop:9152 length:174 start_codon:yes stop_codon:yes gene_type:complete